MKITVGLGLGLGLEPGLGAGVGWPTNKAPLPAATLPSTPSPDTAALKNEAELHPHRATALKPNRSEPKL